MFEVTYSQAIQSEFFLCLLVVVVFVLVVVVGVDDIVVRVSHYPFARSLARKVVLQTRRSAAIGGNISFHTHTNTGVQPKSSCGGLTFVS